MKYQKRFDELIFDLKLAGNTNSQIAKHLQIPRRTLQRWLKNHKPLQDLYNQACTAGLDAKRALIKRATGFSYTEKRYKETTNHEGETRTESEEVTKYYPPDVPAIKYLLQNISTFDKELQHKIYVDLERLDNDKFEKWLDRNESRAYEKLREIYENEKQ